MSRIIAKQLIKKIIVTVSVKAVYLAQNIIYYISFEKFQIKFITFMNLTCIFVFSMLQILKIRISLRIG